MAVFISQPIRLSAVCVGDRCDDRGVGGGRSRRKWRRAQQRERASEKVLSKQMHRAQIKLNLNGRRVFEVAEIRDSAKPYFVRKALKRGLVHLL